ncbi:protein LURP-one-related 15-like [Musa acuminata AAA Group]|uniref:protein LURP-one-related 15-like n=1 Tax=Musa acuminata AAA Group TaxID=214697 RepID=UPI0031DD687C
MGFHGTDGFSIYDGMGRLSLRLDNYTRKRKCFAGELLLMDGNGKAVVTLRPQILSMQDRWSGFRGEDGRETDFRSTHVFDTRRRSVLQSCDEAEVLMDSTPDHKLPDFRTEGCFRRRNCKIMDRNDDEVTLISRNKENKSVAPGDDVFSLIIQPNMETELMAAFLVLMDRICT